MPKPIPVAIRRQIVERRQKGEKLVQIAKALDMPYESIRNVWRLYRKAGRIQPNYAACGKRGVRCSQRVYRAAIFLKRLHPSWGAGLIRQVIIDKWSDEAVPHARSLQRWFRQVGMRSKGSKKRYEPRKGRGKAAHNVWEMDSRECITLANGQKVSWLLVSDEASGAMLSAGVFPHSQSRSIAGAAGAAASAVLF